MISLSMGFNTAKGQTIFVDQQVSQPGNGTSWAQAYVSLDEALVNATEGQEIWVRYGRYILGEGSFGMYSIAAGVRLYGGFQGTEVSIDERMNFDESGENETIVIGHLNFEPSEVLTNVIDGFSIFTDKNFSAIAALRNSTLQITGEIPIPGIFFVDAELQLDGDGLTWGTAFNNLLSAAAAADDEDQIWVKKGVYYANQNLVSPQSGGESISLQSGVELYGGFSGNESNANNRTDFGEGGSNETILDGSLFDVPPELSKTLMVIVGSTNETVIDGISFVMGRDVNTSGAIVGNKLSISNCYFYNNYGNFGGAISGSGNIVNCIFEGNEASTQGGAISGTDLLIEDSNFVDNNSIVGGVVNLENSTAVNSSFSQNQSNTGSFVWASNTTFDGCNFYNNQGKMSIGEGSSVLNSQIYGNIISIVLESSEIYDTDIYDNEDFNLAVASGGVLRHCSVNNNASQGPDDAAIAILEGGLVSKSKIFENTVGGGVSISGNGTIEYSFLYDNVNSVSTNPNNLTANEGMGLADHVTVFNTNPNLSAENHIKITAGAIISNSLLLFAYSSLDISIPSSSYNGAFDNIGDNTLILDLDNFSETGAQVVFDTLLLPDSPCIGAVQDESNIGAYQGSGSGLSKTFFPIKSGNWEDGEIWNYGIAPLEQFDVVISGYSVQLNSETLCNSVLIEQSGDSQVGELFVNKGGYLMVNEFLEVAEQPVGTGEMNNLFISPGGKVEIVEGAN
ncbi:hypothetical protein [Reichenbachiella sp.]|uniref:hypothetical protein n=1 Tax=Reichenbachiella sp. TaxID=2184521 RepID=UPI003298EA92